MIKEVSKFHSN